ncbi:MAG: VUT family protein, partial [Pseudomonadota bacterium]
AQKFLGVGGDVPLWVSLAVGDFIVKVLVGVAMLVPYGFVARRSATA